MTKKKIDDKEKISDDDINSLDGKENEVKVIKKNKILINPMIEDVSLTPNIFKRDETIVATYLFMNPPTNEHDALIDTLYDICEQFNVDMPKVFIRPRSERYVISSEFRGNNDEKILYNLMSFDETLEIAKDIYGEIIQDERFENENDLIKYFDNKYTNIIFVTTDSCSVVESDDVFQVNYDISEEVISREMTKLVLDDEREKFESRLADGAEYLSDEIFDIIKNNAGDGFLPSDEDDDLEESLNMQQRIKRGITMRRYARKIQAAKKRMKHKMANTKMLKKRARRMAVNVLRKKLAGVKGANYSNLSVGEKIQIDKRVEKRKGAIARIAAKLLPKIRKAELSKFSKKEPLKKEVSKKKPLKENFKENNVTDKPKWGNKISARDRWNYLFNLDEKKLPDNFKNFKESIDDILSEETSKIILALKERAIKSGYDFETLAKIYDRGCSTLNEENDTLTASQKGFIRVDSFIAGNILKEDKDLI